MRFENAHIIGTVFLFAASVAAAPAFADEGIPPPAAPAPAVSESAEQQMDRALNDAIIALSKTQGKGGAVDPGLEALLDHREKLASMRVATGADSQLVPILVPVAFFAALAAIVIVPLILRKKRREIDAEVQKAAMEKGMQYVPEIPAPKRPAPNDRRTGLLLAGLGLAALLPLLLAGFTQWCVVGLAPIVLGAVYYLAGVLLSPKADK